MGHLCSALVWWREQKGQVGWGCVQRWARCPNWQQLSHCENRLAGTMGVTRLGLEKRRIEEPMVPTSWGRTETATEVADFPTREAGSGLRNRAERMLTPLALLIEVARASNSAPGSQGR